VRAAAVAGNLIDALAELHRVDHGSLGLSDLGKPDGFVARQVAGWTDRWRRARDVDQPAMEEVSARLAGAIPRPQAAVLLHNDFKLDNTMIGDHGEVVAVLDWDMATIGDPLVDLGTTLAYWGGPGPASVIAADAVMLGESMTIDEVVDRYEAESGLDAAGIDWYRALAMFRIAVIVQQIYIRYRRGQTSDDRFAELGSLVSPLAEGALELL
jgi:aminoglycoside phosphotransferase (APT) family kinase protein